MKIVAPSDQAILAAAEALLAGHLIGLPTETVYGIGAAAFNRAAVRSTFALKGRPADNPLIIHIASVEQMETLAQSIPDLAFRLAEAFWPGPLTLVLTKRSVVPDEVTAGLKTVAVRVPSHPVAQAVLEAFQGPVSAPSANAFMSLSPTRAQDISPDILVGLELVIDGGPCSVGVESTVVDCTGEMATLLRPGGVSRAEIEAVIGPISLHNSTEKRSPGMYPRHYAPRTPLRIVKELGPEDAGLVLSLPKNGHQIRMPSEAGGYATALYRTLHQLDEAGFREILIESPPNSPEWAAVWDRITKAAHSTS